LLDSLLQEKPNPTMAREMIPLLILLLKFCSLVSADTPGVVSASCCSTVFLSSNSTLAKTQSAALGIYTLSSQRIANNPHPVYIKQSKEQDFYLYFRQTETGGPQGWIVGPQLLEDSFYLTTHSAHSACPHGIFGGYDSDDTTKDDTFAIECHYDQVKVDCCPTVSVSSTGILGTKQGAIMGEYRKVGDHNGHTSYQGGPSNTTLFYRKAGHGPDGWMVGMDFEENTFIVTTRDKSFCPDVVTAGFDRNQNSGKDSSFKIVCQASTPSLSQDPGIPVGYDKPLETLTAEKSMSGGARTTLISSAFFRLIMIVYLLVLKLAES